MEAFSTQISNESPAGGYPPECSTWNIVSILCGCLDFETDLLDEPQKCSTWNTRHELHLDLRAGPPSRLRQFLISGGEQRGRLL